MAGGPILTGRPLLMELKDIYNSIGKKAMAKAVWRRALAIRGGERWRFWKSRTTSAPRRYGPGWALSRGPQRPASA